MGLDIAVMDCIYNTVALMAPGAGKSEYGRIPKV